MRSRDDTDFNAVKHRIKLLEPGFLVNETYFSDIPTNSVVILDDFFLEKNQKLDFLRVRDYHLRHRNITLLLLVHNIYNGNIQHELLGAPHILLAYTAMGEIVMRSDFFITTTATPLFYVYLFCRKIENRLGGTRGHRHFKGAIAFLFRSFLTVLLTNAKKERGRNERFSGRLPPLRFCILQRAGLHAASSQPLALAITYRHVFRRAVVYGPRQPASVRAGSSPDPSGTSCPGRCQQPLA